MVGIGQLESEGEENIQNIPSHLPISILQPLENIQEKTVYLSLVYFIRKGLAAINKQFACFV